MKRNYMALAASGLAAALALSFNSLAQTQAPLADYQVVDRGEHHRVWERVSAETMPDGRTVYQNHAYTELADHLCYWDGEAGQWADSQEVIEIVNEHGIARHGAHKVIFAPNIHSYGAIEIFSPDQKHFRLHPLALAYTDRFSGDSVLIAEVKDSIGEVSQNQILYPDCFTDGLAGAIQYVYTRSGIEQNVILQCIPPDPFAAYGMDPETTVLEVITEVVTAPEPSKTLNVLSRETEVALRQLMAEPDLVDEVLQFGAMSMPTGSAFPLNRRMNLELAVPTAKSWEVREGRQVLIEKIEYRAIRPHLEGLPQANLQGNSKAPSRARAAIPPPNAATHRLPAPPSRQARTQEKLRLASTGSRNSLERGYVLDFVLLNPSSLTNYTFQGDTTYFVTDTVNFRGTTVLEGGSVIKYATNGGPAYPEVRLLGGLDCQTSPYRPAYCTAKDDNTVGQAISGSTGSPTAKYYYAYAALYLGVATNYYLHDLSIHYANIGITATSGTYYELRDSQICDSYTGTASYSKFDVANVLYANMIGPLYPASSACTGRVEHITVHRSLNLFYNTNYSANFNLTNCLLICVTNKLMFGAACNVITNLDDTGIFQTVLGGRHYLADSSPCRDCGTTNINPDLLKSLQARTTCPPLLLTNSMATDTVLAPQAQRDTDAPDLGYHYAALDYIASGASVPAGVTVVATNGVAIGIDYTNSSWGFTLTDAKFLSTGSATALNRVVRAHNVQEQSSGNPGTRAMFYDGASGNRTSELRLRFTELSQLANDGYMIYTGNRFAALEWTHCHIYNPSLVLDFSSAPAGMVCALTNTLVERGGTMFGLNSVTNGEVFVRNDLFRNHSLHFVYGNTNWSVRDTLFDTTYLNDHSSPVENSFNAFYLLPTNSSWTLGVSNITLTNLTYQAGPLGLYYYSNNMTALFNTGSRNATNAGLYHFTTTTDQVPETNSIVDIGLHYVAVDANGNPIDTDGDGIPDYVADANGNGVIDPGEPPWRTNTAPVVSAGAHQFILWTNQALTTTLSGTVADDGLPSGMLTRQWTYVSGPGAVVFSDPQADNPSVSFTAPGRYVLRLTASDGAFFSSGTVSITFNQRPRVPSYSWRFPQLAPTNSLVPLNVSYDDDGNGIGSLTTRWELVSGPTNVVFQEDTNSWTGMSVIFATNGIYQLRFWVSDGSGSASNDYQYVVRDPRSVTFSTKEDFARGYAAGLDLDKNFGDGSSSSTTTARKRGMLPFVAVPCMGRSTVVRIDADTGQVLGEYLTYPTNLCGYAVEPRCVAVDGSGNIWVANPFPASVICIGVIVGGTRYNRVNGTFVPDANGEFVKDPVYTTCKDRDGDGYLHTSRGLGDVLPWNCPEDGWYSSLTNCDEAIIDLYDFSERGPYTNLTSIRELFRNPNVLAFNKHNALWVGTSQGTQTNSDGSLFKLSHSVEVLTNSLFSTTGAGKAGLIDPQGILWSTSGADSLFRFNTTNWNYDQIPLANSTGVAIDPISGNIWVTLYNSWRIAVFSPGGTQLMTRVTPYPGYGTGYGLNGPSGVAVDGAGNVWVALDSGDCPDVGRPYLCHLRTNGLYVGEVLLPCGYFGGTGVSVDRNGKIWTVTRAPYGAALRIDPNAGPMGHGGYPVGKVDCVVDLGEDSKPDTLGDMTGYVTPTGTNGLEGFWTVTHDSGETNTPWQSVQWTADTNKGGGLSVRIRAANDPARLPFSNFIEVSDEEVMTNSVTGRYVQILVQMTTGVDAWDFPRLEALTVSPDSYGPPFDAPSPYPNIRTLNVLANSVSNWVDISAFFPWLDPDIYFDPIALLELSHAQVNNAWSVVSCLQRHPSMEVYYYTPRPRYYGPDTIFYAADYPDGRTNGSRYSHTFFGAIPVRVIKPLGTSSTYGRSVTNAPSCTNTLIAADDSANVFVNTAETPIEVLANDTYSCTNVCTWITGVTQPQHGTVKFGETRVTYTPDLWYVGQDEFTYTAEDGRGNRVTASVYVTNVANFIYCAGQGNTNWNKYIYLSSDGQSRFMPETAQVVQSYFFTNSESQRVTFSIQVDSNSAGGILELRAFDPRGAFLDSSTNELVLDLIEGGTNTLEVAIPWESENWQYHYTLNCTSCGGALGRYLAAYVAGSPAVARGSTVGPWSTTVGTSVPISLVLSNGGAINLTNLTLISYSPWGLTNTLVSMLNSHQSCTQTMVFAPTNTGFFTNHFSVQWTDPGTSDVKTLCSFNMRGIGMASNDCWLSVEIKEPAAGSTIGSTGLRLAATVEPYSTNTQVWLKVVAPDGQTTEVFPPLGALYAWQAFPQRGQYRVTAYAVVYGVDNDFYCSGSSTPVSFRCTNAFQHTTNSPPVAGDDGFAFKVSTNVVALSLDVLGNDWDPDNDPLSMFSFTQPLAGRVAWTGDRFQFFPPPNWHGTAAFLYRITDGKQRFSTATVRVQIMDITPPQIAIVEPQYAKIFCGTNSILLRASVTAGPDIPIIRWVRFLANDRVIGSAVLTNGFYDLAWTNPVSSFAPVRIDAQMADQDWRIWPAPSTWIGVMPDTNNYPPIAAITGLDPATNNGVITLPVIQTGKLVVYGTASDSNGADAVRYKMLARRLGEPRDSRSVADPVLVMADQSRRVTNGVLGTNDFTLLENGVYELTLVVSDGFTETTATARITLDTQLKLGDLIFSEEDLSIPAGDATLKIVRSYSSLNPVQGQFGFGWRFAGMETDIQLSETRTNADEGGMLDAYTDIYEYFQTESSFSLRTGGSRDVSLILPEGTRTTFALYLEDRGASYAPCWQSPAGVSARLGPLDQVTVTSSGGNYLWYQRNDEYVLNEHFDFSGFVLTNLDGTEYVFARDGYQPHSYQLSVSDCWLAVTYDPPYLSEIRSRNGGKLVFNKAGLLTRMQHVNATNQFNATNQLDRELVLLSDSQDRIIAAYAPSELKPDGTPGTVATCSYQYANGNLACVLKLKDGSDAANASYEITTYSYTNAAFPHHLTGIFNTDNQPVLQARYDSLGRLVETVDAQGHTNQVAHHTDGNLETVTDRLGNTTSSVYDPYGSITFQTNALRVVSAFGYDQQSHYKIAETNDWGTGATNLKVWTTYAYNANGLLTNQVTALGTNTFTYDAYNQLLVSTDPRGVATHRGYDSRGNLLAITNAFGKPELTFTISLYNDQNLLTSQTDALGNVITNQYDVNGNLTNTAALNPQRSTLSSTGYSYDANGNRTSQTVLRTLGSGTGEADTTTFAYDGRNRVIATIDPMGGTTSNGYDRGKLELSTDALGRQTQYHYDLSGQLTNIVYPDLSAEFSAYDAEGHRTNFVDRAGRVTRYGYDALGRLTTSVYADNTTNQTAYDALGRVAYMIDARGVTNAFGYDAAGRRIALTNAWGTAWAQINGFVYDGAGNLTITFDALGRGTTNIYDALGRVVAAQFADGRQRLTSYDALGRRVAETNEAGVVSRFGYDGLGRLSAVTNAWGASDQTLATFGYDEAGNQTNQVDALGRVTRFEYDALGRRVRRTLPLGQSEHFSYDATGNLLTHSNFVGLVITNAYDKLNRLVARFHGSTNLESYAYSPTGQKTGMTNASGRFALGYDQRDRLRTNSGPAGVLNYNYDASGNLTNLYSGTAGGVSVYYQYDALNRLTNAVDNRLDLAAKNTAYGYDGVGNLARLKYPNEVTNQWQYDRRNRLTNELWKLNATVLASFAYLLEPGGHRTNLAEVINGTSRSNRWAYDQLYRLTNEVISGGSPTGTLGYRYDGVGNRTNRTSSVSGFGSTNNFFDANDWLDIDTVTNNGSAWYDDAGNTRTNGTSTYQYDWANRLTNANNGAVVLTYDPQGNRIKKVVGSATVVYLVDDRNPTGYAQVLEELTVSGGATNLANVYTYGLDLISQRQPGVTTNFYGYGGLGSVRFVTGLAGTILDAYGYDAFGTLFPASLSITNRYRYTGEQWDPDLGLYYLRARYYRPDAGRFWTMDSFEGSQEDPLSLHKYVYCTDDPVNLIDPSGHDFNMPTLMVTVSTWGFMAANLGIRAAPAINRATIVIFEAGTGNTVMVGGGAGAVALKTGTKLGGVGWSTWQFVGNLLKGTARKIGTKRELSKVLERTGWQANHLNQAKAFRNIPYDDGVSVAMALGTNNKGGMHWKFHDVLEDFWRTCRNSGRKTVTNSEYDQVMRKGLAEAGFPPDEVDALARLAEESRINFGYCDAPGGLQPVVPIAIPGM